MTTTRNPYDPPGVDARRDSTTAAPTRASLAKLIESFLDSEITAFEFDERLDKFRNSDDPVVNHVADAVWYHYDDCDDHRVCLSKHQWDYFQRLLLVLSSACRIETSSRRLWSPKQLVAAIALCMFAFVVFRFGWGDQLLVFSIPFGFVSIGLSFWQHKEAAIGDPYAPLVFPFATFPDLATAYHSSGFRKKRYPKQIGDRTIRSPFMDAFWQLQAYTMWLILAPVPLLFQTLPERQTEIHVIAT